jgi:hypothetical protein
MWKHQVRVKAADGGEAPLDDGHSWRKYGQKPILGSNYPRLALALHLTKGLRLFFTILSTSRMVKKRKKRPFCSLIRAARARLKRGIEIIEFLLLGLDVWLFVPFY